MPSTQYIVKRFRDRPIRFNGTLLATAASSPDPAAGTFSGEPGVYHQLTLYQSDGGTYIGERITRLDSQFVDPRVRRSVKQKHEGAVCSNNQALYEFFGVDEISTSLFDAAGIPTFEDIP